MLPEISLTPMLFDKDTHSGDLELRDCLRELGSNLFPTSGLWPAVVSDLHEGTWWGLVKQELENLIASPTNRLLRDLLHKLPQVLVRRKCCQNWPELEQDWLEEACQTHRIHPIFKILISEKHAIGLDNTFRTTDKPSIDKLSSVFDLGYWDNIKGHTSAPLDIKQQVKLLQTITFYSDAIHLLNPYLGGVDGHKREIDFAIALIQAVHDHSRISGRFQRIILHTKGIRDPQSVKGPEQLEERVKKLQTEFGPHLLKGSRVQLYLWEEFKERHIVGCEQAEGENKQSRDKPRWGIHLAHVARRADNPDTDEPAPWRLLDSNELGKLSDRYIKQSLQNILPQWSGFINSTR